MKASRALVGLYALVLGLVLWSDWAGGPEQGEDYRTAAFGVLLLTLPAMARRGVPRRLLPNLVLMGALVCYWAIRVPFAVDRWQAGVSLCPWALALGLQTLLLSCLRSAAEWRRFTSATMAVGLLCGVAAAIHGIGTRAEPLGFVGMSGMFLSSGLVQERGRSQIWWFASVLYLAFLTQGFSVAALLGIGCGTLMACWLTFSNPRAPRRRKIPRIVRLGALVLCCVGFWNIATHPNWRADAARNLSTILNESEARTRLRKDILRGTVELASKHAWGEGGGSFALDYQQVHRPDVSPEVRPETARNDYAQLVVEGGFPALGLWLLILGLTLFQAQDRALALTEEDEPQPLGASRTTLLACAGFGLLCSALAYPSALCWWACVLGLTATAGSPVLPDRNDRGSSLGLLLAACLALGLLFCGWMQTRQWLARQHLVRAQLARDRLSLEAARADVDRAIRWLPGWWEPHLLKAEIATLQFMEQPDNARVRALALDEYQRALGCSPLRMETLQALSDCLASLGRTQEAAETCVSGVKLVPSHPGLRQRLLNLYTQQGKLEAALATATDLLSAKLLDAHRAGSVLLAFTLANPQRASAVLGALKLPEETLTGLLRETEQQARAFKETGVMAPLYRVLADSTSDNWKVRVHIAQLLIRDGQRAEALNELTLLQEKTPPSEAALSDALIIWAELNAEQGNGGQVIIALSDFLEKQPQLVAVRAKLIELLYEAERFGEAQSALEVGLDLTPRNPDLVLLQARLMLQRKDGEGALEAAQRVLESQPDNEVARELARKARTLVNSTL